MHLFRYLLVVAVLVLRFTMTGIEFTKEEIEKPTDFVK